MLVVFTLTSTELTKIYTVYKTPTLVYDERWNIYHSNAHQISHLNLGDKTKKRPSSVQKTGTHTHPWGGRYKPGADLHRCHQSGQWLARICSLVSRMEVGMLPPLWSTADPSGRMWHRSRSVETSEKRHGWGRGQSRTLPSSLHHIDWRASDGSPRTEGCFRGKKIFKVKSITDSIRAASISPLQLSVYSPQW